MLNQGQFTLKTHHSVDCCDDLQHLSLGDVPVAVKVVHVEGPLQLVLELPSRGDAQRHEELSEVNCSVTVRVKSSKDMLGKFGRVTVRKKVSVNLFEFLF